MRALTALLLPESILSIIFTAVVYKKIGTVYTFEDQISALTVSCLLLIIHRLGEIAKASK